LDDAENEAVTADYYKRHVPEIRKSLPAALQMLVEGGGQLSLHDGRFIGTTVRAPWPDLQMDIAVSDRGSLQVPPRPIAPMLHVHLVYRKYELVEPTVEQLFWRS